MPAKWKGVVIRDMNRLQLIAAAQELRAEALQTFPLMRDDRSDDAVVVRCLFKIAVDRLAELVGKGEAMRMVAGSDPLQCYWENIKKLMAERAEHG